LVTGDFSEAGESRGSFLVSSSGISIHPAHSMTILLISHFPLPP
jgi:hypothetical protein